VLFRCTARAWIQDFAKACNIKQPIHLCNVLSWASLSHVPDSLHLRQIIEYQCFTEYSRSFVMICSGISQFTPHYQSLFRLSLCSLGHVILSTIGCAMMPGRDATTHVHIPCHSVTGASSCTTRFLSTSTCAHDYRFSPLPSLSGQQHARVPIARTTRRALNLFALGA
jgi:hypothetical protein